MHGHGGLLNMGQEEQLINQELNQQLLDFSIADASRAHEHLVKMNETYISMTCNEESKR